MMRLGWRPLVLALAAGLLCASSAFAQTRLVFAADVIRHGDRTAFEELPAAPHAWPQGFGQLTPKGMRQAFELGAAARAAYVDRWHLLPSSYTTGTVFARSTDVDRTLMSAHAFLMGLYPPGTGPSLPGSGEGALPGAVQPIPIHTIPKKDDVLLNVNAWGKKLEELMAREVFASPEWKARTEALRPRFESWGRITGMPLKDLDGLTNLWDVLLVYRLYRVPLPAGLGEDDVRAIFEVGDWAFAREFSSPGIGKLTGGGLLRELAQRMREARGGKAPLKYALYAGHDTTLLAGLSALGAPLAQTPPYASRLNFAMFEEGGAFRVEVAYNDRPVSVPACGGTSCTLEQFAALAGEGAEPSSKP